ncbi:MAG TPA: hypothetical protein VFP71_07410 [Candidatus Angelobacter sp.]|nr:hypothetical protein [Candidatus Angelobacter sp.]
MDDSQVEGHFVEEERPNKPELVALLRMFIAVSIWEFLSMEAVEINNKS